MGVLTDFLKLFKSTEDEYYDVETQQNENWDKVETFAKKTDGEITGIVGEEVEVVTGSDDAVVVGKVYLNQIVGDSGEGKLYLIQSGDKFGAATKKQVDLKNLSEQIESLFKESSHDFLGGTAYKKGNRVDLYFDSSTHYAGFENGHIVDTLPEEFRPAMHTSLNLTHGYSDGYNCGVFVETNGQIKLITHTPLLTHPMYGSVSYYTNN